ncbi:ADAM 17-like protease [Argopecten irradians]|uniref:ADAM 17-like protease n=1 Tax=Argopecten irradians TaxID=31199 RepID=UPI00371E3FD8
MVWNIISLLFIAFSFVLYGTQADLRDHVTEHEVIESVTIHSIKRRSTENGQYHRPSRHVSFYAVGRNFSLQLKESLGIFSRDFKFQVIDAEGHMGEDKGLDKSNFYHGWVEGEAKSEVTAYFDGEAMSASIFLQQDELVIEPKWRHDKGKRKKGDNSMIVYRTKHMVMPQPTDKTQGGASFCGAIHANGEPDNELDQDLLRRMKDKDENEHHRSKRATRTRCRLMAVADYRFYSNIGGSNKYTTANYIVSVINRANAIYERTNFGGTGYGFELEQLRLHEGYSPADGFPYNVAVTTWSDMNGLLSTFSESTAFRDYCLVHLFTHQGLSNIYGMGYIAGTSLSAAGGICSLCNTGTRLTCPTPAPLTDGTSCLDQGSCRNGVCLAYCEYRGLTSCVCNDVANSCRRCCRSNGVCSVANSTLFIAKDRPCTYGYCDGVGTCIKTEAGLADRFFDLIDKISFDYLVEAFRTNMVAFVQVFSLIVWVPLSCLCWCRDRRRRKKRETRENLSIRTDRKLIYDLDGKEVINPRKSSSKPHRNMRNMIPIPPIGGVRAMSARAPSESSYSSRRRNQIAPIPLNKQKRRREIQRE